MTTCRLIVDTRERNILRHANELVGITYEVQQIEIGDYVILRGNTVLAVVERKSFDDFAASLKDERHGNKAKLLAYRKATGCRVLYLIEGPEYPAPDRLFGGIPYKNIESSIFHMIIRDQIAIIRAKNTIETARLLVRFITSMERMHGDYYEGGDEMPEDVENPMTMLKTRVARTDTDIARSMWACFSGITVETADYYGCNWSIEEIILGQVAREDIIKLRVGSRAINKNVVKSLTGGIGMSVESRLVGTIPGIGLKTAKLICTKHRLADLLQDDDLLFNFRGESGKKLNNDAVLKFYDLFTYKIPRA